MVGPQDLPICLPPALVPNRTEADLAGDCEGRVEQTLSGLAEACGYPSDCHCGMQANATSFSQSLKWADKCDAPCTEEKVDVANDCANFDPVHGLTTATNADGDQPVCLANSPLGAEVFGRRTTCAVEGTAHVEVGDESKNPHAEGIVQFVGDPCPGESCAVGMQYQLNIDPVTFGNFFHSETFHDLGGVGETSAGNEAVLSPSGDGSFARNAAAVSAQGRRGSQLNGLATTNDDPVDVNVGWGQPAPTCRVNGRLIGSVDPELKRCENAGPDANKICEDDADCTQDDACSGKVCNCLAQGDADLIPEPRCERRHPESAADGGCGTGPDGGVRHRGRHQRRPRRQRQQRSGLQHRALQLDAGHADRRAGRLRPDVNGGAVARLADTMSCG